MRIAPGKMPRSSEEALFRPNGSLPIFAPEPNRHGFGKKPRLAQSVPVAEARQGSTRTLSGLGTMANATGCPAPDWGYILPACTAKALVSARPFCMACDSMAQSDQSLPGPRAHGGCGGSRCVRHIACTGSARCQRRPPARAQIVCAHPRVTPERHAVASLQHRFALRVLRAVHPHRRTRADHLWGAGCCRL